MKNKVHFRCILQERDLTVHVRSISFMPYNEHKTLCISEMWWKMPVPCRFRASGGNRRCRRPDKFLPVFFLYFESRWLNAWKRMAKRLEVRCFVWTRLWKMREGCILHINSLCFRCLNEGEGVKAVWRKNIQGGVKPRTCGWIQGDA